MVPPPDLVGQVLSHRAAVARAEPAGVISRQCGRLRSAIAERSVPYVADVPDRSDRSCSTDLAAPLLATCPNLAEQHVRLRARGVHEREDGWVVARPDDVAAAMTVPTMGVAVPGPRNEAVVGAARQLQARMARFSNVPAHTARRVLAEQLLPDPDGLDDAAREHAVGWLEHRTGAVDVMPLARTVPALVLARALGVADDDLDAVMVATGQLCDALAPSLAPRRPGTTGDDAAEHLTDLLAPVGAWDVERVAAMAGLLFQARDATAALIGAALLTELPGDLEVSARVDTALRQHAPVQCTRRTTATDVVLGGVRVPRGASVWLVLAAAEKGPPARPATFGAGPHACPGAAHATALAHGVLTALHSGGWRAVPGQPVRHEPRPNLRMPAAVLVEQP